MSTVHQEPNGALIAFVKGAPELILDTGNKSVDECASEVLALLRHRTVINRNIR